MSHRPTPRSALGRTAVIALAAFTADAGNKYAALFLASHHTGLGIILPIQNADFSLGIGFAWTIAVRVPNLNDGDHFAEPSSL
jgi:hypothetical protein